MVKKNKIPSPIAPSVVRRSGLNEFPFVAIYPLGLLRSPAWLGGSPGADMSRRVTSTFATGHRPVTFTA